MDSVVTHIISNLLWIFSGVSLALTINYILAWYAKRYVEKRKQEILDEDNQSD